MSFPAPVAPSDAVAAKMAELREEAERQRLEQERQRLAWETARKQEYDSEIVTFEAKLRILVVEMTARGDTKYIADEWSKLIPTTKSLRGTPTIQEVGGTAVHAIRHCSGECLKSTHYRGANFAPTHTTCSVCVQKLGIIASVIGPIALAENRKFEEKLRSVELEEARQRAARAKATADLWESGAKRISAETAAAYSRWQNNFSSIEPRTGTTTFVVYMPEHGSLKIVENSYDLTTGECRAFKSLTEVPTAWNTHYEEGKTPFLPKCPVCGAQNKIHGAGAIGGMGGYGCAWGETKGGVQCAGHYEWDPTTNTHYKFVASPPQEPHNARAGQPWSPYYRIKWDPKDPDGTVALAEAKEKRRQELLKELTSL